MNGRLKNEDQILKRRKKKLVGKGINLSVPKKALTAYAIFVKQKRKEMDYKELNSHSPDIMKDLGKLWSSLSKEDK